MAEKSEHPGATLRGQTRRGLENPDEVAKTLRSPQGKDALHQTDPKDDRAQLGFDEDPSMLNEDDDATW